MSETATARQIFRLWVGLHPQQLTFRQMMPMRREARRVVLETLGRSLALVRLAV